MAMRATATIIATTVTWAPSATITIAIIAARTVITRAVINRAWSVDHRWRIYHRRRRVITGQADADTDRHASRRDARRACSNQTNENQGKTLVHNISPEVPGRQPLPLPSP
jgi:hypothetical protein